MYNRSVLEVLLIVVNVDEHVSIFMLGFCWCCHVLHWLTLLRVTCVCGGLFCRGKWIIISMELQNCSC